MKKLLLVVLLASALSSVALHYILYVRLAEAHAHIDQLKSEANSLRLHLSKREEWKETP